MSTSSILLLTLISLLPSLISSQSTSSGYSGYSLSSTGDSSSAVYSTSSTPSNVSVSVPPPDVYLHASVHVQEIDLTVSNLTAKINLDAQVLSLLQFNAGVDASIDRVQLTIADVNAEVFLEARLMNLLLMIDKVLHSLDLQPILATLATDINSIVNNTVGVLTGPTPASTLSTPVSYDVMSNILYSVNDYQGNTHTNRILAQNGSIIDQYLDNNGNVYNQQVVGYYQTDMTFNGYNQTVTYDGMPAQELEYVYQPFYGLSVVSAIFVSQGQVLGTQVLSESSGGGSSTVGGP